MIYFSHFDSTVGRLWIAESDGFITHITLSEFAASSNALKKQTSLIYNAVTQLREYFEGKRTQFDLPLRPQGTAFQQSVWQALLKIPYGKTCSYQDIAIEINNPKAVRAVGGANNKNPIIIVIPCHRVIGKNGSLVGYGGGLDIKEYLLNHEKQIQKGSL